jgi:predicted MFS family arabinose efflux permease
LTVLVIDIALLPWTGSNVWTAAVAIAVWGGCGWGLLVPQQHRLVTMAPSIAPVLLGLNTAATYIGVSAAGLIGAGAIQMLGVDDLSFVAAILLALSLIVSELATRRIAVVAAGGARTSSVPA